MQEVLLIDDKDKVLKCFKDENVILYLWQDDGTAPKRVIYPSKVIKLSLDSESVTLQTHDFSDYDLFPGQIYCFNEDLKYFFKLEQIDIQSNTLKVKFPVKVNILSESENTKMANVLYECFKEAQKNELRHMSSTSDEYMIYEGPRDHIDLGVMKVKSSVGSKHRSKNDQSLFDEIVASQSLSKEDEVYAGQRKTPRAKPTEGKVVSILIEGGQLGLFTLYDLSTGGMSIVSGDINDFTEQEEISVIGFDEKDFEEPVKAIVRSIRDIDDLVGQYKIGIQFLEE